MSRRRNQNENSNVNEYITILQAYSNGNEIEHRVKGSNDPFTPCSNPVFDFNHLEYRIKPKLTYRPYANGDEAFTDIQNHSPSGWLYNTITMCYEHIICIGSNGISTCKENYSFEQAFNVFVYPNETRFGIKPDEEV